MLRIAYGDVHVIFQRHNQGLNWRNLALNRDIWALLVGFPFDKRDIHEIVNAIRSFGKLLLWDRARSTKDALMVQIRVDELSDVPILVSLWVNLKTLTLNPGLCQLLLCSNCNWNGSP